MIKKKRAGFTFLEILVCLIILSIAVTGIMSVFVTSRRYIARSRRRLQATNLARQILEELYKDVRQDSWDITGEENPLRVGTHSLAPITIDGITYNRSYTVSNVPGYSYRQVTVNVTWTEPQF